MADDVGMYSRLYRQQIGPELFPSRAIMQQYVRQNLPAVKFLPSVFCRTFFSGLCWRGINGDAEHLPKRLEPEPVSDTTALQVIDASATLVARPGASCGPKTRDV